VVTTALILGVLWAVPRFGPRFGNQKRALASVPAPAPSPVLLNQEPAICKDLYRVVCHGVDEPERDPTGLVRPDVQGERIVASIYKDVISSHPGWSPEQIDDELARRIYTPERRGRIEAAYHWVQNQIERFIEMQPERVFNAEEKKQLIERVRGTLLEIPPPASVYADEPDLLTTNDVFYERTSDGDRRMRIGGAYLYTAKSWFNMVFTMGHELGHSIDPCEIRSAQLSFPSYDRLEACFIRTGIVATPKDRVECDENDQLAEAFADWLGSQITAEALKQFSTVYHGQQLVYATANAVRDLCEQDDDDGDLDIINHPDPHVRIGKIFGRQPEIRAILGCTPYDQLLLQQHPSDTAAYCGFDSAIPKPKAPL